MKSIIVSLLVFVCFEGMAQRFFADYMIVGSSLTYMRNSNLDSYQTDYGYSEFTWNFNVGIRVSKRIFTGLQVLNIYSSQISTKKDYYAVYGLFTQYDFFNKKPHRLFAEISVSRGNYCTCSGLPTKVDDLYYIGPGIGYDLPIKWVSGLHLDLSFINYFILNNIQDKYAYTQYVIGLNYRINGQ